MHHLLITLGSHGDTHPFIGLGAKLRQRGHRVTLAANDLFEPVIRDAGLDFEPFGTKEDYHAILENPDLFHPVKGFKAVFEHGILNSLRKSYELVERVFVPGETIVTAHAIAFGVRIAQEKLGIPLATVHLAPAVFRSEIDPPVFTGLGWMRRAPPWVNRFMYRMMDLLVIDPVVAGPINALRREVGLRRPVKRILNDWWHSPRLALGLFPDWYAPPPPDWPGQVRLTGFPLFDERGSHALSPEIESFLRRAEPPIAFTFGSAMTHARQYLAASAEACRLLSRRGLLVTRYPAQVPPNLPPAVMHVPYAPFSELLPRCAALVHHGGIGTTAQALAAGVPHLIMPFAHDQHDNAERVKRLGCGDSLLPKNYKPAAVAAALKSLLDDPATAPNCCTVAAKFVGHDPLAETCELIESLPPSRWRKP